MNFSNLLKHFPRHANEILCNTCGTAFKNREALLQHRCLRHSFKCLFCQETVKNFRAYNEHTRKHYEETDLLKCAQCDFINADRMAVIFHGITHLEKKFTDSAECEFCNSYFRPNEMFSHMRRHQDIEADKQCTLCDEGFISVNYLLSHLEFVHPLYNPEWSSYKTIKLTDYQDTAHGAKDVTNVFIECKLCCFLYNRRHTFESHAQHLHADLDALSIMEYRNEIRCSLCGTQCKTTYIHNKHVRNHQKTDTCKVCNRKVEKHKLKEHMHMHRTVYLCTVCLTKRTTKDAFRNHVKWAHKEEFKNKQLVDLMKLVKVKELHENRTD